MQPLQFACARTLGCKSRSRLDITNEHSSTVLACILTVPVHGGRELEGFKFSHRCKGEDAKESADNHGVGFHEKDVGNQAHADVGWPETDLGKPGIECVIMRSPVPAHREKPHNSNRDS